MPHFNRVYIHLLEDCKSHRELLNEKDEHFLESVGENLCKGMCLTDRQVDNLERIWNRVINHKKRKFHEEIDEDKD